MKNERYKKNLEAIKRCYGFLYNEYNERLSSDPSEADTLVEAEFIVGRRQIPTFSILRKSDNKSIHGHSIFDPIKEAEKRVSVSDFSFSENERIVQLGFGFGYETRYLISKISHPLIIVVEPFFSVFELTMRSVDISDIIESGKVVLTFSTAPERLKYIFTANASFLTIPNYKLLKLPHVDFCPSITDNVVKTVKQIDSFVTLNLNTGVSAGATFLRNTILNFSETRHYPGINLLKDKFSKRPVFVVAPGPSLKKNGALLKQVMGKELIIACDTAVKPLLEMGVKPDIISSIDFQVLNYYKLRGVDTSYSALATSLDVSYFIPATHKGNHFNYFHDINLQNIFKTIFGDKGLISTGGSVLTDAFSIAMLTGADPVVFVGVDLSFPGMKFYADGSFDEGNSSKLINDGKIPLIEIDDIYGNKVCTYQSFYEFLTWIGTNIKTHKERIFIDATEGGAKIEGTLIEPLQDTISKYLTSRYTEPKSIITDTFNSFVPPETATLQKQTRTYVEDFKKLKKTAHQALNISKEAKHTVEISSNLNGNTKFIKELKKINKKRSEFQTSEKSTHMSFLSPLIHKYIASMNYFTFDESETKKDQYLKMLDLEIESFKGIENSCQALVSHFEFLESQILLTSGEDYV